MAFGALITSSLSKEIVIEQWKCCYATIGIGVLD